MAQSCSSMMLVILPTMRRALGRSVKMPEEEERTYPPRTRSCSEGNGSSLQAEDTQDGDDD